MRLFLTLLALASASILFAQTPCESGFADIYPCENIDLMSYIPLEDVGSPTGTNDIWGWVDPDSGREFAILCLRSGTAFVEVTDPVNPVYLGTLPSFIEGNNTWRDAKVFNNYVFVVSEFTGHGMQIMDLTKLVDPLLVIPTEFEADAHYDGFGRAHNIVINEETGHAIGVGTNTADGGLHVVNINNPLNPTILGTWEESGYTHDAQVVVYNGPDADYQGKEIAFCCNADYIAIVDMSDPTDMQEISQVTYENVGYVHQGWLTEDHRFFMSNDETDELNNGVNTSTFIFNMEDLGNPFHLDTYVSDNTSIDHNHYVLGNLLYQSNYRSGLRILDISDVAAGNLSQLAYFDIIPSTDAPGFTGTWSNYPYFPSGNIVVSDIQNGMFVLKLNVTSLPGCTDEVACNYNAEATEDDASCIYPEEFYDCEGACLNDTDEDGVCDELEILGCTDPLACNYDDQATENDFICVYPDEFYDCDGNCLNDADEDGVCDELEVAGCNDVEACNYDEAATDDDGSCYFWQAGAFDDPILSGFVGDNIPYSYTAASSGSLEWTVTGGSISITDPDPTDGETQVSWDEEGTGTLCVTDTWDEGCSGEVCIEISIVVGIEELNAAVESLFPNPANHKCWIELAQPGTADVTVRDAQGRVAMAFQLQGSGLFTTTDLAEGTYTVEVVQGERRSALQLVVQH